MNTPLVSVACITYNHEKYIAQAIEGFLLQKTSFPIEIIIHDDASTDNTKKIVEQYAKINPNLIFPIYQQVNQYSLGNRPFIKYVFPHCRGKYIALCEGDDYWTDPLKLQKQVDFLEKHSEFSICGHWVKNVDESGVPVARPVFTGENCPEIIEKKDALGGTPFHTGSWLSRNTIQETLENHYKLLRTLPAGDDPLLLLILNHGKGYCFREFMGIYRINSTGMWTSKSKALKQFEMLTFYYSIPKLFGSDFVKETIDIVRPAEANMVRLLIKSLRAGEWKQILKIMLSSQLISKTQITAMFPRAFSYYLRRLIMRMQN